jgi:hypothetical protein
MYYLQQEVLFNCCSQIETQTMLKDGVIGRAVKLGRLSGQA